MMDFIREFGYIILAASGVIAVLAIIITGYVKAPPDTAYIISGLRAEPKIIVGRASIRLPFFERIDKISLSLMQVDIKTTSAVPTAEYINIFVDGVANIKVSSSLESIKKASENFLGRTKADIGLVAQQVLEGNMREIVGQMKLSELVQNRNKFASMVQENAMNDMRKMGLEIINLTVQNFVDQNKVIEDLGMDNVVQIKKEAAIARAKGERDIAIATSSAQEEANKARTEAEAKIATQNTELLVKQAELKINTDTKQAEADAAYAIQKEEQRKSIDVASANADLARKEREVLVQEKEIQLSEKILDAKIRKQADAEKYSQEQKAEAELFVRQKEAEAKKYAIIQDSEAQKTKSEALRYAKEQEAVGIKAVGEAQAMAIQEKAEAMRLMGEASVLEMYLTSMPEIVKNAAMPLTQTEKIVMYGDGNATKLVKDVMNSTSQVVDGIREATGIDVKEIINNFTTRKINIDKDTEPLNWK